MSFKSVTLSLIVPSVLAASTAFGQGPVVDSPTPAAADAPSAPAAPAPVSGDAKTPATDSNDQSATGTSHAPEPTPTPTPQAPPTPEPSWFTRPPFIIAIGEGSAQWKLNIYGFAEADYMHDSTRSFGDGLNGNLVSHSGTQAGDNARSQFTVRNSRLGVEIKAPDAGGVKASGKLEGDFFGYDPPIGSGAGTTSEAGFYNNPTFRIRHAYVKLESDYVDLLAGQMYSLFGWQNYYFACAVGFLGLPNEVFGRTQQFRLGHTFKTEQVNVEVAAGAFRPIQRDSGVPDGEAGLRLVANKWKGISTPGSGGTGASPASIGVSGLIRKFKVDQFAAKPSSSNTANGWALAASALIPIVPVKDSNDRANALTLIGEVTTGTGYAEQFTGFSGGAGFPALPGVADPTTGVVAPGAAYNADIDNGLVTYDSSGKLHSIDWQTALVGLQYYVPPGRMILSGNYSHAKSKNIQSLMPTSATAIMQSDYVDGNIFYDTTPSSRLGVSYQYVRQTTVAGVNNHNNRIEALALYFF